MRYALLIGGLAALAVVGTTYWAGDRAGWARRDAIALAHDDAQELANTKALIAAARAASHVDTAVAAAVDHTRTITRTIHDEVPVYVTLKSDRACTVPVGFVELHDAAAANAAPIRSSVPPEADSNIALSAVSDTVSANYGACHEALDALAGWQAWYRQTCAALGDKCESPAPG